MGCYGPLRMRRRDRVLVQQNMCAKGQKVEQKTQGRHMGNSTCIPDQSPRDFHVSRKKKTARIAANAVIAVNAVIARMTWNLNCYLKLLHQ